MSSESISVRNNLETSHNFIEDEDEKLSQNSQKEEEEEYEDIIGNYSLGKTIGKGAFGKVKIGIHTITKEKVAVKMLNKSKFVEESDLIHVQKEISILKMLRHKNIIELYEVIENDSCMFIVMEIAEGGDLFDLISTNGKLDELSALNYFHQLICSLDYLHTLNVAHRDIKPENMLLDYKNEIKLSDFGLSNFYSENNKLLETPCGTPVYASPELLNGDSYSGMFNDIWSSGIVLYAMLTGTLPFDNSNENILIDTIIVGKFFMPEWLSPGAQDLLKNVLRADPKKRFDFEQIKSHPWFNSLNLQIYPGIINHYHKMPIDFKILDLIENVYNEDKQKIRRYLVNYECNEFTTTYFLMLRKFIKEGGKSISDLRSNDYLDYMSNPENIINNLYHVESTESEVTRNDILFTPLTELLDDDNISIATRKNDRSESVRNQPKISFVKQKARESLFNYYLRIKDSPEKKPRQEVDEDIDEIPRLVDRKHGKTVFRRTGANNNIFLDILEKKTLKEADNDGQDCDKLLEFYIDRKNLIESHQRNSIRLSINKKKKESVKSDNQEKIIELKDENGMNLEDILDTVDDKTENFKDLTFKENPVKLELQIKNQELSSNQNQETLKPKINEVKESKVANKTKIKEKVTYNGKVAVSIKKDLQTKEIENKNFESPKKIKEKNKNEIKSKIKDINLNKANVKENKSDKKPQIDKYLEKKEEKKKIGVHRIRNMQKSPEKKTDINLVKNDQNEKFQTEKNKTVRPKLENSYKTNFNSSLIDEEKLLAEKLEKERKIELRKKKREFASSIERPKPAKNKINLQKDELKTRINKFDNEKLAETKKNFSSLPPNNIKKNKTNNTLNNVFESSSQFTKLDRTFDGERIVSHLETNLIKIITKNTPGNTPNKIKKLKDQSVLSGLIENLKDPEENRVENDKPLYTTNFIQYLNQTKIKSKNTHNFPTFNDNNTDISVIQDRGIGMSINKGLVDLSCCIILEKSILLKKLVGILKKFKFLYLVNNDKFNCHNDNLKFKIFVINLCDNGTNYLNFIKKFGNEYEFKNTVRKILVELK